MASASVFKDNTITAPSGYCEVRPPYSRTNRYRAKRRGPMPMHRHAWTCGCAGFSSMRASPVVNRQFTGFSGGVPFAFPRGILPDLRRLVRSPAPRHCRANTFYSISATILHDLETPHPDHRAIGLPLHTPARLRVTLHQADAAPANRMSRKKSPPSTPVRPRTSRRPAKNSTPVRLPPASIHPYAASDECILRSACLHA